MANYTLYNDKDTELEFSVDVKGAKLNQTSARLFLNFEGDNNLFFDGEIDNKGNGIIKIPALKNVEAISGKAQLEVIAESTVFLPWSSKFTVERSKNVTVEVKTPKKAKPIKAVKVHIKQSPQQKKDVLIKEGITTYINKLSKSQIKNILRRKTTNESIAWAKRIFKKSSPARIRLISTLHRKLITKKII